ncbi:MAG: thiamine-phosphate pyrophosphorylase [Candidatus Omnitrophota bacterium]
MTVDKVMRLVDANYNRAKEGLRVCEDIFRFVRDDREVTARLKQVRHGLTAAADIVGFKAILAARDIGHDVGRATIAEESARGSVEDIFFANIQRVKESLRVLEEFAKLSDKKASMAFKELRYTVYEIEKISLEKLQPLSDFGCRGL